MGEVDVLRALIVRQDVSQSWGFRLKGGVDFGEPVTIAKIAPGSPAARIGLRVDDEVTEVENKPTGNLTHSQILDIVAQPTGDTLRLTVERRARGAIPFAPEVGANKIDPPPQPKVYQPLDMTGSQKPLDMTGSQNRTKPAQISAGVTTFHANDQPATTSYVQKEPETRTEVLDFAAEDRRPQQHRIVAEVNQPKSYQPVDLTGPRYYPPGPQRTPQEFYTVKSRPFVETAPRKGRPLPAVDSAAAATQMTSSSPLHATAPRGDWRDSNPGQYDSVSPPPSPYYRSNQSTGFIPPSANEVPQSKTFRMLQSVMSNEEPAAGAAGLPPPKSASLERMKRDGQSGAGSSPRVKVLMSQKYNSPLGMYSANNVIETFAVQAETALESLERQQTNLPEYRPVYSKN